MAIAFFTMKITPNAPIYNNTTAYNNTTSPPPTQAQSTQAQSEPIANFCPNCGASVTSDATFCSNCGKQI
jgi:predicted amidophosphoribosyltransferase